MSVVVADVLLRCAVDAMRSWNRTFSFGQRICGVALALLSLAGCDLHLDPADRPVPSLRTLATMAAGDEAIIRYRSHGCFYAEERTFVIARTGHGARVYVGPNLALGKVPVVGRSFALSERELSDLDEELDHHRSPTDFGCTTEEEFSIALPSQGVLREQHFVDRSCSLPPERPNEATFAQLAQWVPIVIPYDRL